MWVPVRTESAHRRAADTVDSVSDRNPAQPPRHPLNGYRKPMSTDPRQGLRFARGGAGAREIQEVVDEVLSELRRPDSEASVQAQPILSEDLPADELDIQVREEQSGMDPALTTIFVTIAAGLGTDILVKLWEELIWPRVRRRLGVDAVGRPQD